MRWQPRVWCVLLLLGLSACALFLWQEWRWRPWSDRRDVPGAICSVAAGKLPDGREIVVVGGVLKNTEKFNLNVCCYEVSSGRILWQVELPGPSRYSAWSDLQFWVALDGHGDAYITAKTEADQDQSMIQKRSGAEGKVQWTIGFRTPRSQLQTGRSTFRDYLHPPCIDRKGNVWLLCGDRLNGAERLWMSALDVRNGERIFHVPVSDTNPRTLSLLDLVPMEDGGVFLFHGDETQRYGTRYATDGKRILPFVLPEATSGKEPYESRFLMDEAHDRFFVCDEINHYAYNYSRDEMVVRDVRTYAFCLQTGKPLWNDSMSVMGSWGRDRGRIPELVRLRPNGDLEFRHDGWLTKKSINWSKWEASHGIPVPEVRSYMQRNPIRFTVSGPDGKVGPSESMRTGASWFRAQSGEAGSSTKEVFDLNHRIYSDGKARCKDARTWVTTEDGGSMYDCYRVVHCPSGRPVLTRDPQDHLDFKRQKLWQVVSP